MLVVEDDFSLRAAVSRGLTDHGIDVVAVSDGGRRSSSWDGRTNASTSSCWTCFLLRDGQVVDQVGGLEVDADIPGS